MYLKAHGPAAITLQVPGAHTESPVCQIRAQAQLSIKWDWMVGKKKKCLVQVAASRAEKMKPMINEKKNQQKHKTVVLS